MQWLKDHGLSLSFVVLFLISVAAQSVLGNADYNSQLSSHHLAAIDYRSYLLTGNFLDGIFVNWQAALLQLGCLIVFGTGLRERGAAHSRKPEGGSKKQKQKDKGRGHSWIYRHSMSIAFAALFTGSMVAHLFFGAKAYNERRALTRLPAVTTTDYGVSSTFWFSNAQTWEAEFAVIAIYIVSSIFLRQEGSPESKPVGSSDKQTGGPNE